MATGPRGLEDIQLEVVASVIRPLHLVEVVPAILHHRDPPGRRVSVIQVIEAALGPLEVVGVVDIRVIVEPLPIGRLPTAGGFGVARLQYNVLNV